MRQPSINPPSFYDDVAPPPLLTPPPNYDDLTPRIEMREGYFDMDGSESNSDETIGRGTQDVSGRDNETETSSIQVPEDIESESEISQVVAPRPVEEIREEESDNETEIGDGDIVHMVGLEDLSLGLRASSPFGQRGSDVFHAAGRIWVS
jgi:hypothetical protein